MCGIAGFVGFDDDRLLRDMAGLLSHRGPDGEGFYTEPGVGLAHRRLSIIDLATGAQPMANETNTVHVVFNGEVYNYQELTRALKEKGHHFRSASDTETILHLYEDHGLDCVSHLRGMYAFALWDSVRKRLVLARDRIGEKPLYYHEADGRILFGSEIKAILAGLRSRVVNAQAVCEFLAAGYVPAPRTFFEGIHKLHPGSLLVFEHGKASIRRYWRAEHLAETEVPFERASSDLVDRLRETMRLCLKSDVEVGAFLSGGLDSSLIVALMREVNTEVQTFSVGYRGRAIGFNELCYAKRVATALGTKHHELILDAHSSIQLLPKILWHYDEPHGEPTSILVYLLCQFTRQRLSVALGGTGGDELFFGYPRHKAIGLLDYYNLLPRFVRKQLVERFVARWPESTRGNRFAKRVKRFVQGASVQPPEAYLNWVSLLSSPTREQLLSSGMKEESPDPLGDQFMREYLTVPQNGDLRRQAACLDVGGYLPEYQLTYMDRMSMAHGLEVRSPLCDHRLAEQVLSLPASYRLKGQRSKHILKSVGRAWLPEDIVERKKVGFDSPVGEWYKGELKQFVTEFLSASNVARSGMLDPIAVQSLMVEHLTGRRDYSLQLWSIIALEAWYRMYIENGVPGANEFKLEDTVRQPREGRAGVFQATC